MAPKRGKKNKEDDWEDEALDPELVIQADNSSKKAPGGKEQAENNERPSCEWPSGERPSGELPSRTEERSRNEFLDDVSASLVLADGCECSGCLKALPATEFSSKQRRKLPAERRCKSCIEVVGGGDGSSEKRAGGRDLRGSGGDHLHSVSTLKDLNNLVKVAGERLVVVEFTAEWCGDCTKIEPFYTKLARELGAEPPAPPAVEISVGTAPVGSREHEAQRAIVRAYQVVGIPIFCKVAVDRSEELVSAWSPTVLPCFLFLRRGKKLEVHVGAKATAIKNKVVKHAAGHGAREPRVMGAHY